jgi:hypothetical protein
MCQHATIKNENWRKMNKVIRYVLFSAFIILSTPTFVGCDNSNEDFCNHEWGSWEIIKEATCKNDGYQQRKCKLNENHIETKTLFATNEHEFVDNICIKCHCDVSEGFIYEDVYDGGYIITPYGKSSFAGKLTIPGQYKGKTVTRIARNAFSGNKTITEIIISDGITTVLSEAFSGCVSLQKLTIGKTVQMIDHLAFENCINLSEIYYNAALHDNIPESSPTSIYNRFDGAFHRAGINIDGIKLTIGKNVIRIPSRLFARGSWGSTLNDEDAPNITVIEFEENGQCQTIAEHAFYNLVNLKEINLPETITYIGKWAFIYCKSLQSITFPNSLSEISDRIFMYCYSLENVVFNSTMDTISEGLFYNCTSLNNIQIPSNIKKIYKNAYNKCSALNSVVFQDPVGWICTSTFPNISYSSIELSSNSLSNPETAARYLKTTYTDKYWMQL